MAVKPSYIKHDIMFATIGGVWADHLWNLFQLIKLRFSAIFDLNEIETNTANVNIAMHCVNCLFKRRNINKPVMSMIFY